MAWHHAYILVRFSDEPGIKNAVKTLANEFASLSTHVHAAFPSLSGDISVPFDDIDDAALRKLQGIQQRVLSAGCLVVAAAKPGSISKLPAVESAWFFWLIGSDLARTIRNSSLGAAASRQRRRGRRGWPSIAVRIAEIRCA
ncbi:MAG TPA: hypothetical protein VG826_03195 [Pirellulales bacterium]|nr:hypothetical protein [Pirellulales bacterium]